MNPQIIMKDADINLTTRVSLYILCAVSSFLITCSNYDRMDEDIITIDLQQAIQKEDNVPLSKFADRLEYIPLEMTQESGIKYISKVNITDEYIIVRDGASLFLFNRDSGKFIRQIGNLGRGPEEYIMPLECFFNQFDRKIYTYGYLRSSVKIYDINGDFRDSFITPALKDVSIPNLPIDAFLDSITYTGYIENSTGNNSARLTIFSKDGIIRNYPNYIFWSPEFITIYQNPKFFMWNGHVSFKEASNDTVFYIEREKLTPRLVLLTGKYQRPYKLSRQEALEQLSKPKDYFEIFNIFENSKYLFFDLVSKNEPILNRPRDFKLIRNFCIYDKLDKKTYVCRNNSMDLNSGLTDDINSFLQISPIGVSEKGEMIAFLQAAEIIQWKETNKDQYEILKEKYPLLEGINELDNPVIVIAR